MNRMKTGFALFAPVVGIVIGLAVASKASAADYQVAYAIDARGVKEPGKYVKCTYGTACRLGFENTSVRILIAADEKGLPFILVRIYGNGNCCYFSDGNDEIWIKIDEPDHKFPIFEGRKEAVEEMSLC